MRTMVFAVVAAALLLDSGAAGSPFIYEGLAEGLAKGLRAADQDMAASHGGEEGHGFNASTARLAGRSRRQAPDSTYSNTTPETTEEFEMNGTAEWSGDYENGTGSYEDGSGGYENGTGSYEDGSGGYENGTGSYEDGSGGYEGGSGDEEDGSGDEVGSGDQGGSGDEEGGSANEGGRGDKDGNEESGRKGRGWKSGHGRGKENGRKWQ